MLLSEIPVFSNQIIVNFTYVSRILVGSFGENDARKIIALSYYQIGRGKALSNAEDWLEQRGLGKLGLSSPRVSGLLGRLKQDKVNTFFQLWAGGTR